VDKGRLKLRVSPQTPLDPMKLMAWVRQRPNAQLSPDGTVLVPAPTGGAGAVRQAQEVLAAWAEL
jgi:transcription-repair coupling factor (superfamily II helicase)